MTVRMGETYVTNGQLTQAGYSALRGIETAQEAAAAALDARVDALEGYGRRVLLATRTASASALRSSATCSTVSTPSTSRASVRNTSA